MECLYLPFRAIQLFRKLAFLQKQERKLFFRLFTVSFGFFPFSVRAVLRHKHSLQFHFLIQGFLLNFLQIFISKQELFAQLFRLCFRILQLFPQISYLSAAP